MHILEINTEKTWRGGERQTFYTVKGLLNLGCTVSAVCLRNSLLAEKMKENNFNLIEVDSQSALFFHLLFNSKRYDVIHVQNAKALVWVIFSKLFRSKPVVYTRRVDFVPKGFFTLWKYRRTNKIIAISQAIREILEQQGIKGIEVIPSMVEEQELNKARAEKVIRELGFSGKKIIATTAALVPHKDPETMVNAISELKKLRNDFVFLHFGRGEMMEEMKFMVEKQNFEKHYIFMGFRENVADFFAVMDVFVMSSQEEGLGSSVLDAFVYEVPVASTDAGGLKETVEGYGLLSPVKDFKSLAANINQLLNDETLRKSLTAKAKQRVIENYGIKENVQQYLSMFNNLLR